MTNPIKPDLMPNVEISRTCFDSLGFFRIDLPGGTFMIRDGNGLFVTILDRKAGKNILVMATENITASGLGCQLDGASARTIAATLLRLADEIDPICKH